MSEKSVIVYKAFGQLDAQMIKNMLEASGIPAQVSQESAGQTYGFTVGPLGEVDILVPQNFEQEAITVLEAYERGELDLDNSFTDSRSDTDPQP